MALACFSNHCFPAQVVNNEGPGEQRCSVLVCSRGESTHDELPRFETSGGFQLGKWGYPKLAGWFLLGKNPNLKWMMTENTNMGWWLGVPPFQEPPRYVFYNIYIYIIHIYIYIYTHIYIYIIYIYVYKYSFADAYNIMCIYISFTITPSSVKSVKSPPHLPMARGFPRWSQAQWLGSEVIGTCGWIKDRFSWR